MTNHDAIHHPSHYTEGRQYEPKDVIRDWGLNFNIGSAVKYLSRAGRKDNTLQDLKKAIEFIQFEIEALEAEHTEPECGVIEFSVPEGKSLEDTLQSVLELIYKHFGGI